VIFAIHPMCRASEAFRIEVLKNAYKKNLDQKLKCDSKKKAQCWLKKFKI
jgi:hypothetical protein